MILEQATDSPLADVWRLSDQIGPECRPSALPQSGRGRRGYAQDIAAEVRSCSGHDPSRCRFVEGVAEKHHPAQANSAERLLGALSAFSPNLGVLLIRRGKRAEQRASEDY